MILVAVVVAGARHGNRAPASRPRAGQESGRANDFQLDVRATASTFLQTNEISPYLIRPRRPRSRASGRLDRSSPASALRAAAGGPSAPTWMGRRRTAPGWARWRRPRPRPARRRAERTTPCSHLLTVEGCSDRRPSPAHMAEAKSRVPIPLSQRDVAIARATGSAPALRVIAGLGPRARPGREIAAEPRHGEGRRAAPGRTAASRPRGTGSSAQRRTGER
jgi:hypothetical protein